MLFFIFLITYDPAFDIENSQVEKKLTRMSHENDLKIEQKSVSQFEI